MNGKIIIKGVYPNHFLNNRVLNQKHSLSTDLFNVILEREEKEREEAGVQTNTTTLNNRQEDLCRRNGIADKDNNNKKNLTKFCRRSKK